MTTGQGDTRKLEAEWMPVLDPLTGQPSGWYGPKHYPPTPLAYTPRPLPRREVADA